MARNYRSRGLPAPKRQIANDGLEVFTGPILTFGAAAVITGADTFG